MGSSNILPAKASAIAEAFLFSVAALGEVV